MRILSRSELNFSSKEYISIERRFSAMSVNFMSNIAIFNRCKLLEIAGITELNFFVDSARFFYNSRELRPRLDMIRLSV